MFNFTRWGDMFGDQVSKIWEARTGEIRLLHDSIIEAIPDMDGALHDCWIEGVKPKVAAQRFVAYHDAWKAASAI